MTVDVRTLLPLYVIGALEPDEVLLVERAVAADVALAAELAAFEASATELIAPVAPGPDVHARLLASIGGGRFEPYAGRMASLFDVTVDRARELLGLIERAASWETPIPGVGMHLVHFDGGPAAAAADCGFVRLSPGTAFPQHTHRGEEVSLLLAGTLRDDAGRVLSPGDELISGASTEHIVTNVGDEPCIYAARAIDGIEIGGAPARPPHKT